MKTQTTSKKLRLTDLTLKAGADVRGAINGGLNRDIIRRHTGQAGFASK